MLSWQGLSPCACSSAAVEGSSVEKPSSLSKYEIGVALTLVFFSGFSALMYQVLWMKQIGLLFGNTSQATGATLTSFFAGLAAGSWVLGRKVSKSSNPMRTYAWLEFGIAITALLYFGILWLFQAIYPTIHQNTDSGGLRLLIKFSLSLFLVFPPAFCMGGTIPVIGQYMVREGRHFGRLSALMYGLNTLGAAIGVGLAGFYLPLWLGYNRTCASAVIISAAIGVVAWLLSRQVQPFVYTFSKEPNSELSAAVSPKPALEAERKISRQERRRLEREKGKTIATDDRPATLPASHNTNSQNRIVIIALCFLSGFSVLALEVVWTRLFSQVLENSIYTFSAILLIVLLSLAVGSIISSQLTRIKVASTIMLSLLLLFGAVAVAYTPHLFMKLTDGMQLVTSEGTWSSYMLLILGTVALGIGPAAMVLGTVFPFLMKVEENQLKSPGLSLGTLATINTVGAIIGSLSCGFILLDWLGIWQSMHLIAWIYVVSAIAIPTGTNRAGITMKGICFIALIAVLLASPRDLPVTSTDPKGDKEKVVECWEGSDCTVSVTESMTQGLSIKINSDYSLGSTSAYMGEKFQADLPLMIKPDAEEIFFLGVGTGITAGSALEPRFPNVKRVVACELSGNVFKAAKKYFTDINGFDATGGLFDDPRAKVLIEDGRHYLMATNERFDIINADLFVPFRSGAGNLYTVEHFESCKSRLKPSGIFVQWLPLYQLTEYEFSVICRSLLEVFDEVSMWRHNFTPNSEIVALVGHTQPYALSADKGDVQNDKKLAVEGKTHLDLQRLNLPLNPQTITLFYQGNLGKAREFFGGYPLNTDNRPVIEYMAPRNYRRETTDEKQWFTGQAFHDFARRVLGKTPPLDDPLLAERSPSNRRLPLAGHAFHQANLATFNGNEKGAKKSWAEFVREWTNQ